jgi:hypothetical protein
MLPYGEYQPDVADTATGVSPLIQNCIPIADPQTAIAYKPFPSFVAVPGAGALPSAPRGGISIVNPSSGNYEVYGCTSSNIYQLQADYTWVSIGSGYSLPAEEEWSIVQFGNYLVFTNRSDGMLQYNVVTPGAITLIPGAPKARFLFVAFDCIHALDCDGEARLMRNSATNDHTQWTPGKNNSQYQPVADGQELIAGGAINDATAIVLQRNSIRVLNRTGDSRLYTMNKLADNVGCVNGRTLASIGTELYFQSTDGFYKVNASGVTPIGAQRVNRTYLDDTDPQNFFTCQAAIDPVNKLVIWLYHPSDSLLDQYVLSAGLAYSWQLNVWVDFEPPADGLLSGIFQLATPGYGMDSIDGFGDLDHLPYSLDSRFWNGGEPSLAGFSSDYKVGFFNGAAMEATLWTQTNMAEQSQNIIWVTPLDDADGGIIGIASRDRLADTSPTLKSVTTINSGGRSPIRARGKINQGRRTISAGTAWSYARGVEYIVGTAGGFR